MPRDRFCSEIHALRPVRALKGIGCKSFRAIGNPAPAFQTAQSPRQRLQASLQRGDRTQCVYRLVCPRGCRGRARGCLPRPRPEESEPRASPRDARPRRARPRVAHVETTRWRSRSRMPRGPHGPLPVALAWAAPGHMTWYLPWRTCTYPKAQRAACAHPLARRICPEGSFANLTKTGFSRKTRQVK